MYIGELKYLVALQEGRTAAEQRGGHPGRLPDGLHEDRPLVRDAVRRALRHRRELRPEHVPRAHVHIGDSAAEPSGRPRHGQSARGHDRPTRLPDPRHRADLWHERRLAPATGPRHLPGHPAAHTPAVLLRVAQVTLSSNLPYRSADFQTPLFYITHIV